MKMQINNVNDYLTNDCLNQCVSDTANVFQSNISLVKTGKVRDVYSENDNYYLVASDRISAFDRNLTTIPYKGIVLNKVSRWWFNKTKHLVPNQL